jgi:hypothetical protein
MPPTTWPANVLELTKDEFDALTNGTASDATKAKVAAAKPADDGSGIIIIVRP